VVGRRDREEALPIRDGVREDQQGRLGSHGWLPGRSDSAGDPESLPRGQDAPEREPVDAREPRRPHPVAAGDRDEALPGPHGVDKRRLRLCASHPLRRRRVVARDSQALPGGDDARQAKAVRPRERRGANAVAARDHDEAFARPDEMEERLGDRGGNRLRATCERTERPDTGDPVRSQTARALEAAEGRSRRGVEAAVDPPLRKAEPPEVKLERRDIPADPAGREHSLPEKRHAERSQLATRCVADLAGRLDPVRALEPQHSAARLRPGDPVHRSCVEPLRAQRDLERRDPGALRCFGGPGERQDDSRRDHDHDDSAHGIGPFAAAAGVPPAERARLPLRHAATLLPRCRPR
jgi:hypothetical protein